MFGRLYAYSLLPVLAVALLLFFSLALRGRRPLGLTLFTLSIAIFSGSLLLAAIPRTAELGEKLVASGAFIAASYLHSAYDLTQQKSYHLVWLAYGSAFLVAAFGVLAPGALYGANHLGAGPLFWPVMALAIAGAGVPSWKLIRGVPRDPAGRARIRRLLGAGALTYAGGLGNAVLLSHGLPVPYGMWVVLCGLLFLAQLVSQEQPIHERRILERSLLYSGLASFLGAGFLFGVLSLYEESTEPFAANYRIGALFFVSMAALAFEPIRQHLAEIFGRRLVQDRSPAGDLARALEVVEDRADHAERLAEIGTLVSAVAHELRNPLGVISAHVGLLKTSGAEASSLLAIKEQIDRASRFVDDLLRYGRARPVDLRSIDLLATVDLALSTAKQGLGLEVKDLIVDRLGQKDIPAIEGDQLQLSQVFVILFENALLSLLESGGAPHLSIAIEDSAKSAVVAIEDAGQGVPKEIQPKLFYPFVTSRKRVGPRPGTGLGLATAKGIVERHGGTLTSEAGRHLSGARFVVELPRGARKVQAFGAEGAKGAS